MESQRAIEMESGDFRVMALEIHEVKMVGMSLVSAGETHRLE